MLTAKDIARHFGVSNSTARGWLLRGRIKGAELRQSELGQPYWVAPEDALKDFTPPRPGPVPRPKGNSIAKAPARKRAAKKGGKK